MQISDQPNKIYPWVGAERNYSNHKIIRKKYEEIEKILTCLSERNKLNAATTYY